MPIKPSLNEDDVDDVDDLDIGEQDHETNNDEVDRYEAAINIKSFIAVPSPMEGVVMLSAMSDDDEDDKDDDDEDEDEEDEDSPNKSPNMMDASHSRMKRVAARMVSSFKRSSRDAFEGRVTESPGSSILYGL